MSLPVPCAGIDDGGSVILELSGRTVIAVLAEINKVEPTSLFNFHTLYEF